MDVTDSIGVHKTRPALHVATIRQIEYQESTAAVANTRNSVVVNEIVFGAGEIRAGIETFHAPEERRVRR